MSIILKSKTSFQVKQGNYNWQAAWKVTAQKYEHFGTKLEKKCIHQKGRWQWTHKALVNYNVNSTKTIVQLYDLNISGYLRVSYYKSNSQFYPTLKVWNMRSMQSENAKDRISGPPTILWSHYTHTMNIVFTCWVHACKSWWFDDSIYGTGHLR